MIFIASSSYFSLTPTETALKPAARYIKKAILLKPVLDLFPWTPLGLATAILSFVTLRWLAFRQLDLVLLVIGYGGLAAVGISTLLVCAVAAWIKVFYRSHESDGDPLLFETGTAAATGFSLSGIGFFPFVQVQWSWQSPVGVEVQIERAKGSLKEVVTFVRRGQIRRARRRILVSDVLGLSQVAFGIEEGVVMDVLPRVGNLNKVPELLSMASGDQLPFPTGFPEGDRFELQRYMPGDPARFIHWKIFGRTRKLMTRYPERSQAPLPRMAAFFIAGADDDATAAIARLAIEKGLLGSNWLFGTDDEVEGTANVGKALHALMRSAIATDKAGCGMAGFFSVADRDGPSRAVVFAPPEPGPWTRYLAELSATRVFSVVMGVDAVVRRRPTSLWHRLITKPSVSNGVTVDQLQSVLRALPNVQSQVLVLNRTSGQSLEASTAVEQ